MIRGLLVLLFAAAGLSAQFSVLPDPLVKYLELTDAQRRQIVQINLSLSSFQAVKVVRSAQVQVEISRETREPNPDAMALGLRYRELEAIRREVDAEQARTVEAVQAVLTAAQRTKLAALQEVLRMQTTACYATAFNFLSPPQREPFPGNVIPESRISPVSTGTGVLSGLGSTSCYSGAVTSIPIFSPGF